MRKIEGYDSRLLVSDSPRMSLAVAEMRDKEIQKDAYRFRGNAKTVGQFLAYEQEKRTTYATQKISITTPLGVAHHNLRTENPLILNILRAADSMVQGTQEIYRQSPVGFLDAKRVEGLMNSDGTIDVRINYQKLPDSRFEGKRILIPDIMLATGSSLVKILEQLKKTNGVPEGIDILSVIGAKQGVEHVLEKIPGSRVYLAAMDNTLTEIAYIFPGLGDAGDLCFNGGVEQLLGPWKA